MVNFGQLAAEIYWRVWGTPQISTGFASWLRYCSDVAHRRPTKLHELYNTAPEVIRTRHFDRKFKSFLKRGTVLPTSLSSRKRTPLPIGPIRLIPYVPIGPTFVIAFEWFDPYCIYPYYPPILIRFAAWRAVIMLRVTGAWCWQRLRDRGAGHWSALSPVCTSRIQATAEW